MARTTSYTLGDELDAFIQTQIADGRYTTASEVVRAALESFKEEKRREAWLHAALDKGLKSGRAKDGAFDRVIERIRARAAADKRRAG